MDILISSVNDVFSKSISEKRVYIMVFKTNIQYKKDVKVVSLPLNQSALINSWNIDLDDCDKILRIESHTLDSEAVISIIQKAGYCCEELAD
ncbi:MAG: hypothetical protein JWN56_2550 [Sphingobacteriales bacterium]|nr:hypothetical protein [Sphingobacteriales bacterium]